MTGRRFGTSSEGSRHRPRAANHDPLRLIRAHTLMQATTGRPEISVGVVDGPVAVAHPALGTARLRSAAGESAPGCSGDSGPSCRHGTFVAGLLFADRGALAPGLAPGCSGILRSLFPEGSGEVDAARPTVGPHELAASLVDLVDEGARVINLSVGLSGRGVVDDRSLGRALDHAFRRGVLVVAAAGNTRRLGPVPLFSHPWVIPVVACDARSRLQETSNLGLAVGRHGLMAPGADVTSTLPGGGFGTMSGTSVAAPFVTGVIALLWSLFPGAEAWMLRRAVTGSAGPRTTISPPLLDAGAAWRAIESASRRRITHGR